MKNNHHFGKSIDRDTRTGSIESLVHSLVAEQSLWTKEIRGRDNSESWTDVTVQGAEGSHQCVPIFNGGESKVYQPVSIETNGSTSVSSGGFFEQGPLVNKDSIKFYSLHGCTRGIDHVHDPRDLLSFPLFSQDFSSVFGARCLPQPPRRILYL